MLCLLTNHNVNWPNAYQRGNQNHCDFNLMNVRGRNQPLKYLKSCKVKADINCNFLLLAKYMLSLRHIKVNQGEMKIFPLLCCRRSVCTQKFWII